MIRGTRNLVIWTACFIGYCAASAIAYILTIRSTQVESRLAFALSQVCVALLFLGVRRLLTGRAAISATSEATPAQSAPGIVALRGMVYLGMARPIPYAVPHRSAAKLCVLLEGCGVAVLAVLTLVFQVDRLVSLNLLALGTALNIVFCLIVWAIYLVANQAARVYVGAGQLVHASMFSTKTMAMQSLGSGTLVCRGTAAIFRYWWGSEHVALALESDQARACLLSEAAGAGVQVDHVDADGSGQ